LVRDEKKKTINNKQWGGVKATPKTKGNKMNKTKHEQLDELIQSQIWIDFNKHEQVENYLEAIYDDSELVYWNQETFLNEMRWLRDGISSPDELSWIEEQLEHCPKEVYKLRNHMKYYINKWEGK
tara:strand:+ start:325 stop:699 length:375 start_codon:yes stop_codon:yes gene_type:complete